MSLAFALVSSYAEIVSKLDNKGNASGLSLVGPTSLFKCEYLSDIVHPSKDTKCKTQNTCLKW